METLTKRLIELFCAKCGAKNPHAVRVDHNEEFVAECQGECCDRFLKFPRGHVFAEEQN